MSAQTPRPRVSCGCYRSPGLAQSVEKRNGPRCWARSPSRIKQFLELLQRSRNRCVAIGIRCQRVRGAQRTDLPADARFSRERIKTPIGHGREGSAAGSLDRLVTAQLASLRPTISSNGFAFRPTRAHVHLANSAVSTAAVRTRPYRTPSSVAGSWTMQRFPCTSSNRYGLRDSNPAWVPWPVRSSSTCDRLQVDRGPTRLRGARSPRSTTPREAPEVVRREGRRVRPYRARRHRGAMIGIVRGRPSMRRRVCAAPGAHSPTPRTR